MIQRFGEVFIRMLENVKQVTIKPFIQKVIAPGTKVFTDEYDIYFRTDLTNPQNKYFLVNRALNHCNIPRATHKISSIFQAVLYTNESNDFY